MKRIKLIFEKEKEKILYPEKQSDIYLESSIKTLGGKTFPEIKELGKAVIDIKNKVIEFSKTYNILYNNIDNVKANIDNLSIGSFKSADLGQGEIETWTEIKGTVSLPIGYYYVRVRDLNKKGTLTILEEKSFKNSTFNTLDPMSLTKYKKSDLASYIKSRFYLYDDKYINISYGNCLYAFCIIKDLPLLEFFTVADKSTFKKFFSSPEDYLVALVPIVYTKFDDSKNKKFSIDDIKNW